MIYFSNDRAKTFLGDIAKRVDKPKRGFRKVDQSSNQVIYKYKGETYVRFIDGE